jgi:hypothetical protein
MRNYEFKLKLPVEFIPHDLGTFSSFREINFPKNLINQEFVDFLASLNLYIDYAKYFYSVPYQRYMNHRDILDEQYGKITKNVKLNFVTGGAGSEMIWYKLNPGKDVVFKQNYLGQPVCAFNDEDLTEAHRAVIGWPSLLDAYEIHTLQNADEARKCWSFTLNSTITKDRISWDEAVEIFKDYLIAE